MGRRRRSKAGKKLAEASVDNALDIPEAKKTKLDSSFEEQDGNNDYKMNSSEDESCSGKALRNPIIVRNIFKHFSTSFLLSSCSLVDTVWQRDARIFVRNNRKCTARNPDELFSHSTCQRVQDLSYLCCQMTKEGREVPFNSFKLELLKPKGSEGCPKGCDGPKHKSLPSEMNLKYLDITCFSSSGRHPVQDSSIKLIRKHASEIQHLMTESLLLLEGLLGADRPATFPKLKEITVSEVRSYSNTVPKKILRSIHATSPNLKTIRVADTESLYIVPEELYGLVGNLVMSFEDFDDRLLRGFVDKRPRLRELTIDESYAQNGDLEEPVSNFLQQLLNSCQDSLEDFTLYSQALRVLPRLPHIPLKNLTYFSLRTHDQDSIDQIWNLLASIGSAKMMSKLMEMNLKLELSLEGAREWPPIDHGRHWHSGYCGVRKLALDLRCVTLNMLEIKAAFPNVTSLDLTLHGSEHVPCREFWELWPDLEELNVTAVESMLRRNYDAEFCGISEEEVVLLREMDDEYLRAVHIVPIRQSLLTMRNLHSCSINYMFSGAAEEIGPGKPLVFISKVTEQIVLKRVSYEKASVSWGFQSSNDEGEDESDDEDDYEEDTDDYDDYDDDEEDSSDDDEEDDDDDDDEEYDPCYDDLWMQRQILSEKFGIDPGWLA